MLRSSFGKCVARPFPLLRAAALTLALSACAAGRTMPPPAAVPAIVPAAPAAVPTLAEKIEAILERPAVERALWGIEVWDPARGEAIYRHNAEKHFVPASNLKLVVATAGAHLLGAEYRYSTTLYATGAIEGGVLRGDLVVYGTGDPMLSARYAPTLTSIFEAWADSLQAHGVRRIRGGIVADQSAWDTVYTNGDWSEYDLLWWYAAPTGALGYNDNSINFRVAPGETVGAPAKITAEPRSSFYRFDNRTTTVAAGAPQTLDFSRVPGTNRIFAYGEIPFGTASGTEYFAVVDPARYTATVLKEVLERKGIRVGRSEVRVHSDAATSPARGAREIFVHHSPPLPQVVLPILRTSQNWFADQLLKTLGKELRGEGSWQAGRAVERDFLVRTVGIDSAAFVLRDGSGLSSANLITPHALVQLLAFARTMPESAVVREALPVSGQPGSLRTRLTDLGGRVAAKTGYIYHTDALSGYLTLDDGRELIFSIIANASGSPSAQVKAAIDDIVRAVAASGAHAERAETTEKEGRGW
jgi:D-alanyl-D-alanine carboxypeptidase/D-alanyl-D-alanine-endopeptidase (penicillin-binding protein 4)